MRENAKFNNNVKIEGYVYSIGTNFNQLSERTTGANSKKPGTKYIGGDLDIAVDEAGLNIVTIHYSYVTETYASGSSNNTYTALKRIIENPNNYWINGGKENAFKVSCTGAAIALNDFIGGDKKKVSVPRIENGFCSIISELSDESERNKFTADMLITKVTHIDADPEKNINEDYCSIGGAIFGYGPKLLPISFTIRNPEGMNYFEDLGVTNSDPVFTKVWGHINCMTVKVEKTEESAFGEAAVQTYESKKREYLITGASRVPYDFKDESVLTVEDVNKMMQDRQIMLAEIEKRFNESQDKKTNATSAFNATAQTVPTGGFKF